MSGATFLHFIDNRFVSSVTEAQFEKRSPVDGSVVGLVAEGGPQEIAAAVAAANAALKGPWARLTLAQRTDRSRLGRRAPHATSGSGGDHIYRREHDR